MDQVKQVMAQAIKHQFWIITGLATVLAIVGYFMTSSKLNKLYTDQAKLLDDRFKDISSVSSAVSTHPNEHSKVKMQVIIDKMAADVQQAWELQFQRQEKILVWPESAIPNKRLLDKFKKYFPPETTLNYPEEPSNIARNDKDKYAEYFAEQMPRIAKIIGCTWVGVPAKTTNAGAMGGMMGGMKGGMMGGSSADAAYGDGGGGYPGSEGMGGMGGYGGMGGGNAMLQTGPKDLVIWPKSSQDELINSMRLWKTQTPTLYEILYTQENMWILEGVMNIIAKTNEGAVENFQTTIKQIEFIRIGKPAVGKAGNIDPPLSAASAGGMGSMDGADMAEAGPDMMSEGGMMSEDDMMSMGSAGSEGGDGMPGEVVSPDPANGRYVDSTFTPITGEDLRTKMKNEGGGDAYFAVAKRIPVRLRFRMDQRRLPIFLANCGNADLMLEIRQVRMGNTQAASASGAGARMGMMMGGMMGGGSDGGDGGSMGGYGEMGDSEGSGDSGYGDMGMSGMGGMMGGKGGGMGGMMGMGAGGRTRTKPAWEMPIEVYGVIYLYNPVDIKKLGLDKVTEDTVVSDTVTPAAETPAAAAPAATAPATPANPDVPADNPNQPSDAPAPNPGEAGAPVGASQ